MIISENKAPTISAHAYPKVFFKFACLLINYKAIKLQPNPDKSENK
jgi:hypothetical protein